MRSIFLDHGNPMNALLVNPFTQALWNIPIGKIPKKIVIISAHWLTEGDWVVIGSHPKPPMIYDMYGFPDSLYKVQYPVSGDLEYAFIIHRELTQNNIIASIDPTRGIDHGIWSVLIHMFPKANIPVIPISVWINKPGNFHFALGKVLDSFLNEEVLIVCSGNITHNLRELDWKNQWIPFTWAHNFDASIENAIENNEIEKIVDYINLPGSRESVPTPDHFYPFLTFLWSSNKRVISSYHKGFELWSLSTRIYIS